MTILLNVQETLIEQLEADGVQGDIYEWLNQSIEDMIIYNGQVFEVLDNATLNELQQAWEEYRDLGFDHESYMGMSRALAYFVLMSRVDISELMEWEA